MGGTAGGGVNLVWGLLILMLRVVLAFAGVAWATVVVGTGAGSEGDVVTGAVAAGRVASTCTVGLMVTGEADLATNGAGAEVEGGKGVTVVGLLGAGLMGVTFMDDIITTGAGAGGGGLVAGTVLTTTGALVLPSSNEGQEEVGDTSKT